MCWQDLKIGAKLRQSKGTDLLSLPGGASTRIPANNRRVGFAIHGNGEVDIRVSRGPGDADGLLIYRSSLSDDPAAPGLNTFIYSRFVMLPEIGNDIRGEVYVSINSGAQSGSCIVNQIEYCGPESLDEAI